MIGFLAATTVLITLVVMPTTVPFRIIDTQEDSIKIKAFERNYEQASIYAKSFCDEKGKKYRLNNEESRDYMIVTNLHDYKFDCTNE
tara:strand:+ start:268 stop:528 length:261 start_codon:yes stop_codon:yes gene_type:complete